MVRNTVTPSNPNAKRTAPAPPATAQPGPRMVLTREHKNLEAKRVGLTAAPSASGITTARREPMLRELRWGPTVLSSAGRRAAEWARN